MQTQDTGLTTQDDAQTPATGQGPTQQGWRAAIEPWKQAALATLPVFLLTRLVFLLLTYFGAVLFTVPNYSPHALSSHDILYSWYRWDVIRYATIAEKGYVSLEYAAFFPLLPLVERIVSIPLLHNVYLAGMLISNLAFFGTLVVLYRFVATEFDRETAKRTALYLSIFPTALFFFAAYNESLFLFFTLLFFYTVRRRSWWLAGLFGAVTTLTRSIGLFLALIFLYEFARQVLPDMPGTWKDKQYRNTFKQLSGLLAILFIPLGLVVYAYYLSQRLNDPLAFLHAQVYWREGLHGPWYAPFVAIKSIFTLSPFTFAIPHDFIELTMLGLFLTLMVLCFVGPERFSASQWSLPIFGLLALLYALIFPGAPGPHGIPYDPMPSMERFVLEIFAGFILLARLGRRSWFHQIYLLVALPMLAFFVLQFITGHWTI